MDNEQMFFFKVTSVITAGVVLIVLMLIVNNIHTNRCYLDAIKSGADPQAIELMYGTSSDATRATLAARRYEKVEKVEKENAKQ
jgi:hypothetical protein